MAQTLERFYQDSKFRAMMGQAGRARAEQVYSGDQFGERLLKIYEEVLGAPSPRGIDGR
jgi:glycosyltransferase involved in cell wall biosynthesis